MAGVRVLAGSARGRALAMPPSSVYVRPILARIKKSVFDIIAPRIVGCRFVDLFAGIGSVGIEALSRGAASCVFVESDRRCADCIEKNLATLSFMSNAVLVRGSVEAYLDHTRERADMVFIGAPYRDAQRMLSLTTPTISSIARSGLIATGGLIIAQHHAREAVSVPETLVRLRQERYGDSIVSFIERRTEADAHTSTVH